MKKFISYLRTLLVFFVISLVCLYSVQGCCAKASSLRFAQVSDAHFSSFEEDTSYKVLKSSSLILDDVVDQINNLPDVDFTVFTGDLINKSIESELMKFLPHANLLRTPWYPVFGNHDVSTSTSFNKQRYFDIMCCHNKNFCYKNSYYSFCPKKGYKAIVLDTIFSDKCSSNGRIDDEQLAWLKDELNNSKGDIVLIFTHVPVIEPYPSENHRLLNSYELKLLLKKYDNPIIVCSGHYHATRVNQEDNVLFIESPSLVTYPCAFRVVNIVPNRNKVLVDVYIKETRLKAIQDLAKVKCMASPLLYGSEQDRNYTYIINKK